VKLRLRKTAADEVQNLPTPIKRRLKAAMKALVADPFGRKPPLEVRKLRSEVGVVYRLKVGGWRIVYLVKGDLIEVVRVFPRDEGYGWMERFRFL
jgi:mRNA-degrading endonuclease RelE of RelBE toxin-antitoxin system